MPKCNVSACRAYLIAARKAAGYDRREDASCYVPYASVSIGRHERGEAPLTPADALLYAQAYRSPELLLRYCRDDCPIGCKMLPPIVGADAGIALLSTRFSNRMRALAGAANRLAAIADDDVVDASEREDFDELVGELRDLLAVYTELQLYTAQKMPSDHGADTINRAAPKGFCL